MKFQYSPGLIGYGPKGTDGSDGLQGMSLYFTDYDVVFNRSSIEHAIEHDYALLSTSVPETVLPGGRTYVTGDLFVDPAGSVYVIDAVGNTFTDSSCKLSRGDYFYTKDEVTSNGYVRYLNRQAVDSSAAYLIDNMQMKSGYGTAPVVYGMPAENYTRIEYADVSSNNYVPFTLYSAAEYTGDDHQALAIVYNTNYNTFRIGNTPDSVADVRNVCLQLDVWTLRYNRPNRFSTSTASKTVLTSNEKNPYLLFDSDYFDPGPASFTATPGANSVMILWDLEDFVNAAVADITGDLYFYRPVSGNYSLTDVSEGSPMVLHDVEAYAWATIDGLSPGTQYQYYMVLTHDGWERRSSIKTVSTL